MAYEKTAAKDGGLVLLYDGSVEALPAAGVRRLLGDAAPRVHVHPRKLTPADRLAFGPDRASKDAIPIKGEATLVFVDLDPGAPFDHPTQCVLVSAEDARVVAGKSWLVLNGEPLFRDGKGYTADFAVDLSGR